MEQSGRFKHCFVYTDHNNFCFLYTGQRGRKKLHHFITVDHSGSPSVVVQKKDDSFFETLRAAIFITPRCLYYTDLKKSTKKYLDLFTSYPWSAEAKSLAYEVLGKRVLSISFTEEGGRVGRRGLAAKVENLNIRLGDICEGLKLDPTEVRKWLRESDIPKPGGRWEWPPAQVAEVTRKIKEFFSA